MKSGRYFKFIGIVEIIGWFIGSVCYIVKMIAVISASRGDIGAILLSILGFVGIIVFGPAVGALFIAVGNLVETNNTSYIRAQSNARFKVGDKVILLKRTKVTHDGFEYIEDGTEGIVRVVNEIYCVVLFEVGNNKYMVNVRNDNLKRIEVVY